MKIPMGMTVEEYEDYVEAMADIYLDEIRQYEETVLEEDHRMCQQSVA